MKTGKKALLLALCAVLLVAATVMGTMAYLTSTDKVTNTFTVGKVKIELDEAKVDVNGAPVDRDGKPVEKLQDAPRVDKNTYKLMPGHAYTKDPTVHVEAGSENSWIFVKVENDISAFEATTVTGGYQNIEAQIKAKGWTKLENVDNVYYKEYTSSASATDLEVFNNFKIADNAQDIENWGAANNKTIVITAYAVQKDGLNVTQAWDAVKNITVA